MGENTYKKQIIFDEEHLKAIEEIKRTVTGVNSLSEAVRHSVMSLVNQSEERLSQEEKLNRMQKKINGMAKDMSILVSMVAGGADWLGVKEIKDKSETEIYNTAKRETEKVIQRSVTRKSNKYVPNKKEFVEKKEIEILKPESTGSNFYI